jgi:outer membrane protein assembly factor BamB
VLVLSAAAGAAVGWYAYDQTRTRELRGSSTVEFVPTANPADTREIPTGGTRTRGPLRRLDGPVWWPTYGYDIARTRVSPPYGLRPPFRRLWAFRAAHFLEFPPAAAYGRVYLPQQRGRFFALDAATGKILWSHSFRRCLASSPTVVDGVVYQGMMHPLPCPKGGRSTARGRFVAMDARTGKILWQLRTGVVESSSLLVDGRLYFGSWDNHLYAVRARDGKILWRYRADDELNGAPAYAGGTIFVGSDGGRVHAVDARTGRARWVASAFSHFGRREYFYASPVVAYGRVYAANTDGTVYAFGAGSGRLLWAKHAGTYVYTAPAVWHRRVFVGTYDGWVLALDAATGDVRWRRPAPAAVHGAPTVLSGRIYFATCGTCGRYGKRYAKRGPFQTFALNALTGRLLWTFPDGRYSPVVADRKRVFIVGSTRLYALVPRGPASQARARQTAGHR